MIPSALCPACAAPLVPARIGNILGGAPTAADIEATAIPGAERVAARTRSTDGPLRCASCGETSYRIGTVIKHRGAPPVLTMAMAADRLRNHLRRRAIVRPGRIDGDCYLLPFVRFEGKTPEGDDTFTLLAASVGDERLEAPFLPPADLRPWDPPAEGAAGPSGSGLAAIRVQPPSLDEAALRARAESRGWTPLRSVELIHYPFWLMRVDDCGRMEGAWMDGIEGKLIFHRLLLPSPVPSRRSVATLAALPSLAAAVALAAPSLGLPAAVGVFIAAAPLFHAALLRSWRG